MGPEFHFLKVDVVTKFSGRAGGGGGGPSGGSSNPLILSMEQCSMNIYGTAYFSEICVPDRLEPDREKITFGDIFFSIDSPLEISQKQYLWSSNLIRSYLFSLYLNFRDININFYS